MIWIWILILIIDLDLPRLMSIILVKSTHKVGVQPLEGTGIYQ